MAKYFYTALKDNKHIVKGEVEALSPREAREKIRVLGYLPTKIYLEETAATKEQVSKKTTPSKLRLSLDDKIAFTSTLEVMVSSQIPILEALDTVENNAPNKKIKRIARTLKYKISRGYTFSDVMEESYSETFGLAYVEILRTGEVSGELDVALGRVLALLRKQKEIKNEIIGASIYPGILLFMIIGFLMLFSLKIFPAMTSLIGFNGGNVPFMANLLMGYCTFMQKFWYLFVGGILGLGYAFVKLLKIESFKRIWDTFLLGIPKVSDFVSSINLANFMTVLYLSYEAGIPILTGIELSARTVGNYIIRDKILESISIIKNGKGVTEAFARTNAIPPALLSMIGAGEKSGALGKMLRDAANVLDQKVNMTLKVMTEMFYPTVILIIGCVVGFIALAFHQLYASMWGSLF